MFALNNNPLQADCPLPQRHVVPGKSAASRCRKMPSGLPFVLPKKVIL